MIRARVALLQVIASVLACRHISFPELRLWDCGFKQVLLFLSHSLSIFNHRMQLLRLREGLVKRWIRCYFIPSFPHSVSPSAHYTSNSDLFLQIRGASIPHMLWLGPSAFCLEWVTLASAGIGREVISYDHFVKASWRSLKLISVSFLAQNRGSVHVCGSVDEWWDEWMNEY